MKNCIFLLFTATILITACKTEPAKNDSKSPNYSETEKLEIAALAANYENGFNQMLEFSEGKAVIYRNDSIGCSEQAWIWHIQSSKKELEDLQKLWAEHFEKN